MNVHHWTALIPAYNAADTIAPLLKKISGHIPVEHILVVDDASEDETAEIVQQVGAGMIKRRSNGGKGRALRDGFEEILKSDCEWIICLDADGQHDPGSIPAFQQKASEENFGLLVGNRRENLEGMPPARQFSNVFSSKIISLRTGLKMFDVQCGYRAVRCDLVDRLHLKSERYDIEVEMILKTWKLGYNIGWIPIPTIYQGEKSFLKKFPETVRFLKLLVRSYYE